ncbi:very short patch repair endonuclease [Intrasporangium sp.]|uniref:very short patch repair endonuclease n=1 Tax=Intrasporangium sp. TaxID=1925024 RepID=UPI0033656BC4
MINRPPASTEHVRRRFSAQKRQDTAAELRLRRALHAAGLRYRVGLPVPGAPRRTMDIAFTKAKVAVQVDGCFWHGCPEHGVRPKSNAEWWRQKLMRNTIRDRETDEVLESAGWRVIRIWEHEVSKSSVDELRALVEQIGAQVKDPAPQA